MLFAIALQSVFAVAANQDVHQIDTEHLKIEHSHAIDDGKHPVDSLTSNHDLYHQQNPDQEHDQNDCHHCGHCHGSHTSWVAINHIQSIIPYQDLIQLSRTEYPINGHLDNLLRPPIS